MIRTALRRTTSNFKCVCNAQHYFCASPDYTHFGFESVPTAEKQTRVNEVFHKVADSYDLMNDAMSLGIHRLWKDSFVKAASPRSGMQCIDMAGGTGDIAFRLIKFANYSAAASKPSIDIESPIISNEAVSTSSTMPSPPRPITSSPVQIDQKEIDALVNSVPPLGDDWDREVIRKASEEARQKHMKLEPTNATGNLHVTVCDINSDMMRVGQDRAVQVLGEERAKTLLSWKKANAEKLPFEDNQFDLYTIAFGIRNCTNVQQVLNEAFRVLKPYGRFMCLEFSEVQNPLLKTVYDDYSFQVIPVMGQLLAGDWDSYQYLVESIRQFPNQHKFADMLRRSGLQCVHYSNYSNGIVAVHSGLKLPS